MLFFGQLVLDGLYLASHTLSREHLRVVAGLRISEWKWMASCPSFIHFMHQTESRQSKVTTKITELQKLS